MSDIPESERISLPFQALGHRRPVSALPKFLTYLVFEGHGLRVGLELSSCVIAYTIVSLSVPWQALGIPLKWSTLISWFGCCFLIILFDQAVLCRSVYIFRKSYLLGLSGAYERAIMLLEKIGPASNRLIKLPLGIYHLQRAELFICSESFPQAETELTFAELAGASPEQIHIARSKFYRAKGNFLTASAELQAAEVRCGQTPALLLEQGVLLLEQRSDNWTAKQIFRKVMELPEAPMIAGESSYELGKAFWNVTRLSTGEAEDGLEDLYRSVDRLRSSVPYVDTLRPVLAQILLERAHYFATHREPTGAMIDLKVALTLCTYPTLMRRAEQVKEELRYRHNLSLN